MAVLVAGCKLPRLLAGAFLWLAAALATPALAVTGDMLYLTTDESSGAYVSIGTPIINNGWTAFQAEALAEGMTPIDERGKLSNATAALPITANTKLLVVVTFNGIINAARLAELTNAMQTRPDTAIVIFSDGCCQVASNLQKLTQVASGIRPTSWPAFALSATNYQPQYSAILNIYSLYASTFSDAGLSQINGEFYTPINNVLPDYALYTQTALTTAPPPTTPINNVVGLFIPQTASNNGQGACLFLTSDASEFGSGANFAGQHTVIAKAFTAAALDLNGACKQPVVGVPDLWVSLSMAELHGPSAGTPTPSAITLTVGNLHPPGVIASADGKVEVTLPTGLQLVPGTLPAGCTATTSVLLTCTLPGLDAGDSKDFPFEVIATAPVTNASILAEVSNVTGEINTANNTYALTDVSTPATTPDLYAHLTGVTELGVGIPSTVTLTVANSSDPEATDALDGQVEVILPADLQLSGNPTGCPGTVTLTATGFICKLNPLSRGASTPAISFEVVAPDPIMTETSITAVISQVTGETNLANNTAMLHDIVTPGPDLVVAVSGPDTLPVGTPSNMTLTVINLDEPGIFPSADGEVVDVVLPGNLTLVVSSLPTGCAATTAGFHCTLAAMNPGDSVTFPFQVIATAPMTDAPIQATVTWGLTKQADHRATKLISAATRAIATAVPALGDLTLALLALVLATAGIRYRRTEGTGKGS